MIDTNLTPKQELFAQSVASGMTQADAYRTAYDAVKMKPETVQKRASELMTSGEVSGRVNELRQPIIAKVGLTLEAHLLRLEELSIAAQMEGQFGPSITAEVSRGKACGHYTEKVEMTNNQVTKITILKAEELDL